MGGLTDPTNVIAGAQAQVIMTADLLDSTDTPLSRWNLTFLRGFITLRVNSNDALLSAETAFGFISVDGDAAAGGVTPDPALDVDAPWMYWDSRVVLPASDSQQHLMIDIKTKRKMTGNDRQIMFIIDNVDAVQSLDFSLAFRLLFAL